MGQGSSQLLTHMWIMKMTQKPWYITEKGMKSAKKRKESKRLKKYNSKKEEFYTIDHTIKA